MKLKNIKLKEKYMENTRMVNKLHSVFDIMNCRSILLPYTSSIRVLFEYDVEEKKSNFTILNDDISENTRNLFVEMLKDNITSDKIIYGLDSNNLEYADLVCKGTWMGNSSQTGGMINNVLKEH
jgi:hypothetical protein